MRILIVEDGTMERSLFETLFQESNSVEMVLANTLKEANERISGANFVVLDLTLPDSTPEKSLEWMKSCGVPAIVYSATWTPGMVELAAKNGAVSFLTKGTPADHIMASVHFALAKEELKFECREQRIEACKELSRRMQERLTQTGCKNCHQSR